MPEFFPQPPAGGQARQELFIPAEPFFSGTGGIKTFQDHYPVFRFPDAITSTVYIAFKVPGDVNGVGDISVVWTTPASSGVMLCDITHDAGADGESITNHAIFLGNVNAAAAGANTWIVTSMGDPTTLLAGDYVGFVFTRSGGAGGDTLSQEARILGFLITFD